MPPIPSEVAPEHGFRSAGQPVTEKMRFIQNQKIKNLAKLREVDSPPHRHFIREQQHVGPAALPRNKVVVRLALYEFALLRGALFVLNHPFVPQHRAGDYDAAPQPRIIQGADCLPRLP